MRGVLGDELEDLDAGIELTLLALLYLSRQRSTAGVARRAVGARHAGSAGRATGSGVNAGTSSWLVVAAGLLAALSVGGAALWPSCGPQGAVAWGRRQPVVLSRWWRFYRAGERVKQGSLGAHGRYGLPDPVRGRLGLAPVVVANRW